MKKNLVLFLLLVLAGCDTAAKNTLTQISTIDALPAGGYDGQMTLADLRRQADFALGTFSHVPWKRLNFRSIHATALICSCRKPNTSVRPT